MKKEHQHVISEYLGVEPIEINSALVSAQNRRRLSWTNIEGVGQPEDKGILLKHILEESPDEKYNITEVAKARIMRKGYSQPKFNPEKTGAMNTKNNSGQLSIDSGTTFVISDRGIGSSFISNTEKVPPLLSRSGCSHDNTVVLGCDWRSDEGIRVRENGKSGTLSARARNDESCGQLVLSTGVINNRGRCEVRNDKSMCLDANYFKGIDEHGQRTFIRSVMQINPSLESNGKQPYQQNRIYDAEGIMPALNAELSGRNNIYSNSVIRRLTPVECERLQTVPDNYTKDVSDTQRYKMLGNGWTVDVIAHIFKNL